MSAEFNRSSTRPSRVVAHECWNTFINEINGYGLAYEFECSPETFDSVIEYTIPKHIDNPEGLRQSIETFDNYRRQLRDFVPFPLSQTVIDYSGDDTKDREITRKIEPKLVDLYDIFADELATYAQVIEDVGSGKANLDEAVGAAISLCKIAKPGMWDPDVLEDSPEYFAGELRSSAPRWYLELFMHNTTIET